MYPYIRLRGPFERPNRDTRSTQRAGKTSLLQRIHKPSIIVNLSLATVVCQSGTFMVLTIVAISSSVK